MSNSWEILCVPDTSGTLEPGTCVVYSSLPFVVCVVGCCWSLFALVSGRLRDACRVAAPGTVTQRHGKKRRETLKNTAKSDWWCVHLLTNYPCAPSSIAVHCPWWGRRQCKPPECAVKTQRRDRISRLHWATGNIQDSAAHIPSHQVLTKGQKFQSLQWSAPEGKISLVD